MAKKKQIEVVGEENIVESNTSLFKDINKKYGDVIKTGKDILKDKQESKMLHISPIIDACLKGGVREGTWIMMSGAPKCGKAQPYDSIVYTPNGPTRIGSIGLGDLVCTPDGKIVKVKGVFPQGYKDVYEIKFSDGTKARSTKDHLWKVRLNNSSSEWKVITLNEMIGNTAYEDRNRWLCPCTEIINFNEKEVPIDPYFFGILLSWAKISKDLITFKNLPDHLIPTVSKYAEKYNCKLINNMICSNDNPESSGFISFSLRNLNADYYKKYKNIPPIYKYNSDSNRLSLLHGIFTRGAYQHRDGYIEYDCRQDTLSTSVAEVIRSLGLICKKTERSNEYRLTINTDEPYELLNKQVKKITKRKKWKSIELIEKVSSEACVCIEIDSEEGLYLTDGFNVTHNTTTAMQLAANCQAEGRPIIFINSECRLSEMNFDVPSLNPDKMIIVTPENKPLSAEQYLNITEMLISHKDNYGALCIIDSISSLIPERELTNDVDGSYRPGLPRVLSNFVKKAGQIVPRNKITMVMITHLITNISGYGGRMADGGIKIQYQADTRMEVKSIEPWEEDGVRVGQAVNWKIHYSSLGAEGECQSWIRYGEGIDKLQELIKIGEQVGFVKKSGSWFTIPIIENGPNVQGINAIYDYLKNNPNVVKILEEKVAELLS